MWLPLEWMSKACGSDTGHAAAGLHKHLDATAACRQSAAGDMAAVWRDLSVSTPEWRECGQPEGLGRPDYECLLGAASGVEGCPCRSQASAAVDRSTDLP